MAQKLIDTQVQKLTQQQVQKLTQQQMLVVRMLEMPITELEQSIKSEIDDNPALECDTTPDGMAEYGTQPSDGDGGASSVIDSDTSQDGGATTTPDGMDHDTERQERSDALDAALQGFGMDDDMPATQHQWNAESQEADYEEMVYGDQTSFYDSLKEQMVDVDLNGTQRYVMEYVIGSLDSDGLLRKDTDTINDELAIYHAISTTNREIDHVIGILQTFDPAGIGARSLKECLMLQIARRKPSRTKDLMMSVAKDHFDDFMNRHWDKIRQAMAIDSDTAQGVMAEMLRLNPKPGAALGETEGRNMQQITPDFIVDTADDGTVTFSISRGQVPELYVSPSFQQMADTYRQNKGSMSRRDKEALLYAKEKMDRAKSFIDAVKQRQHTMYVTMKAIVKIQMRYFQDGDEADLKPMILKDVADMTGLDISTISRVSNMKYAQTRWGTFKLRHFFTDSITTQSGEEMSTRKLKMKLKDIVGAEDKTRPLSDDAIKDLMTQQGFPIARRTVAKYREQMGIPVARLRKE